MSEPLRVLCLDIEGGYGGSSRSLYYSLKHIDRTRIVPTVWCRRDGPIRAMYAALGVPVEVVPGLPKASALRDLGPNLVQSAQHTIEFWRARNGTLDRLTSAAHEHDLIHFNHEGFAALAAWLRRATHRPATMHIRTQVAPTAFSRLQMKMINRAVDAVVFITPNEEATFRSLGGAAPGKVIFNIVEGAPDAGPHPGVPRDGRLRVASLSNAALVRGTDRLLDLARALAEMGRRDIVFVMAGDMTLKGSWPGDLAAVATCGGTLEDAAQEMGLSSYFVFLGHVPDPERVLAASDLLIKPTRDANPWGRDIIEAMAAGKPVVSLGTDTTFVETAATGILMQQFEPEAMAAALAGLADDRPRLATLGRNAAERVGRLCSGPDRAHDLADLWCSVASGKH